MGRLYYITCKNEQCQYHTELREGVGWVELLDLGKLEEEVWSGKMENSTAREALDNGAIMNANAIYLCQHCKEFQNNRSCYMGKITEPSPEEFHYEISFPFGKPTCEKCNNELIYINEPECSNEIKCPKCGGELKVEVGFFD